MKTALLILAATILLAGCGSVPKVSGGRSTVALPDGTATAIKQGDNAAMPTTQVILRETVKALRPTPPNAPSNALTDVIEERATERIETTIGSTQDVASIVESTKQNWGAIIAFLMACAYCYGGYKAWRKDWPVVAFVAFAGAAVALLSLNPYIAAIPFLLIGGIYVAHTITKATVPAYAIAAAPIETAVKPTP
jgi:uncharacterized protein YceK